MFLTGRQPHYWTLKLSGDMQTSHSPPLPTLPKTHKSEKSDTGPAASISLSIQSGVVVN